LIWLVPAGLTVLWLLGKVEDQRAAVKALVAGLIALGVNQLIALLWFHPRPFMAGIGHTYLPHVADSSFPSDHVTLLLSAGLALWATRFDSGAPSRWCVAGDQSAGGMGADLSWGSFSARYARGAGCGGGRDGVGQHHKRAKRLL